MIEKNELSTNTMLNSNIIKMLCKMDFENRKKHYTITNRLCAPSVFLDIILYDIIKYSYNSNPKTVLYGYTEYFIIKFNKDMNDGEICIDITNDNEGNKLIYICSKDNTIDTFIDDTLDIVSSVLHSYGYDTNTSSNKINCTASITIRW